MKVVVSSNRMVSVGGEFSDTKITDLPYIELENCGRKILLCGVDRSMSLSIVLLSWVSPTLMQP